MSDTKGTSPYAEMLPPEIDEILSAASATQLFGTNVKRAEIRYRRLVRTVHPDLNGNAPEAVEATSKLNSLWSDYKKVMHVGGDGDAKASEDAAGGMKTGGKSNADASGDAAKSSAPAFVEICRSDLSAMFRQTDGYVLVNRKPRVSVTDGLGADAKVKLASLAKTMSTSPVGVVAVDGRAFGISQPDGTHESVRISHDLLDGKHRMCQLSDIGKHLTDGKLDAEDAAWIMKRLLFIDGVLTCAGINVKEGVNPWDGILLLPDKHFVLIYDISMLKSGRDEKCTLRDRLLKPLLDLIGDDAKSKSMRSFARGSIVDKVTSDTALLEEMDDFCQDVFGGIAFHKMPFID